jgi:hypothetical protein
MATLRTVTREQAWRCARAGLLACLGLIPALASAEVYRCTDSGKTVYSDKPCGGDMTRVAPPTAPAPPSKPPPINLQHEAGMGRIAVGMTPLQVEEAWGKPAETGSSEDAKGTLQRWTYIRDGEATDVFIRNGAVAKISDPHVIKRKSAAHEEEPAQTTASDIEAELRQNEEQERLQKANERPFIRQGMTQADVQLRIGPPAAVKVVSTDLGTGTYWIYPATSTGDAQTRTVVRFDHYGGHVISVSRVIEP